jgi:hypothetical protein
VASVIEYKANDLTKFVINYLTLNGHFASRIQSQGQYHPKHSRWVKSKVRRGIGDIIACIDGRFVMIEIKAGKDRQSEYQKQVEKDVNESGGYYWIVRHPDEFIAKLRTIFAGNSNSHTQPTRDNKRTLKKLKKST